MRLDSTRAIGLVLLPRLPYFHGYLLLYGSPADSESRKRLQFFTVGQIMELELKKAGI